MELARAWREGRPYGAVLIDDPTPEVDAEMLAEKIKTDDDLKATRLILMPSKGMRGDASRMKSKGFAAYLSQPLEPDLLRASLVELFGRNGLEESEPSRPEELITRHSLREAQKKRLRILVAEDNAVNRKLALNILSKFGYPADAVENGRQAVEALKQMDYSLVLMDLHMPDMDGLEATRTIRDPASGVKRADIPIIAMTASAMQEDHEQCLTAGMDDYLTKPIDPQKLLEGIVRWGRLPEGGQKAES